MSARDPFDVFDVDPFEVEGWPGVVDQVGGELGLAEVGPVQPAPSEGPGSLPDAAAGAPGAPGAQLLDRRFSRVNIRGKAIGYNSSITGFVGANGSGKTLAMVDRLAIPALRAGRPVVSNFQIDHPLWIPLTTWRQIPALHDCTLLFDEITAILPSRQSASMPPELQRVLNQLRKVDVQVGWSAPHWSRADVILREVTQSVVVCSGMRPDFFERDPDTGKRLRPRRLREKGWSPNRVFLWRTFDAVDWEDYSSALVEKARPQASTWYVRSRGVAQRLYDTMQSVALLDHIESVGTCVHCGGRRTVPRCSCGAE